uniref:dienelactone hydrolase family protein n=1 Tax=Sphingomonas bacterium TaxID=1895847 RepID=UPI00262091D0|nr:dienelactone hydrolase family protein [Sphingomonas bacterium]
MAAISVAPAIAGTGILGFAGSAFAATDAGLNARKLRYAICGGQVIDGYFAGPRGRNNLDVVVVLPDRDVLDAKAEATARRYAQAGFYAIAPDLRATFKGGNREAMVAQMVKAAGNLKRFAHGSGKVTIVSA